MPDSTTNHVEMKELEVPLERSEQLDVQNRLIETIQQNRAEMTSSSYIRNQILGDNSKSSRYSTRLSRNKTNRSHSSTSYLSQISAQLKLRGCRHRRPLGQGGPALSSMGSNTIQNSPPSSGESLLGMGSPIFSSMNSSSNQTSGPSLDLSLLGREVTTSISSNRIQSCRYDVFISFRGTDTRNTFVDHLYAHLIRKGIFTFKDDERLQKGELISPQLVQAIQDSRVSIVVFSKDYAASSWCLDEMATIADCHQQFKQVVFPIFYDVDPSLVRNQNGVYKNAFVSHTEKFKHDPGKVYRWKRAMTGLAGSAGWDVKNKPESTMIEKIVQEVIKTLNHKFSWFMEDLIGIQPRVEELEKLLKLSSENHDFRVLGIWGMGGIGKTTHATVLYDRVSYQFDACCFIENVSKMYRDGGAIAVQKQILHQALDERDLDARSSYEISKIMINRLHSSIKVLVVLDNVDQLEQLQELFINPKLLCTGSRIVITTRDEHILRVYGADEIHKVPLLNENDARKLFYRKAFKSEDQSSTCVELIPHVLNYAQYLPLAIRVVGSFLCTRDAVQWRDALNRMENDPDNKIMDVLKMSIDGLQYEDREIFLHIACFFKGEREDYVKRILNACGLNPYLGIQSIAEKSLITIRNEEIHMHEMLQELGKKVARQGHLGEPRLWSRVWLYEDFHRLLMTKMDIDKVQAIVLNPKEDVFNCKAQGLSKLVNLRLLILYHKNFSGKLEFLSNNLQYLLWHGFPFPTLPSEFEPNYLVELNMPYSNIQQLWKGCKDLPFLKRVDLSNSKFLIETPNFEGIPELVWLDLTGCTNLWHVHPSIGRLSKLVYLSLRNCSSLQALDFGGVSNLCSLRILHLSGCTKLEYTPDFTGVSNLEYLDMDGCTSLYRVHKSIGALGKKLKFLSLKDCTSLVSIPDSINTITNLLTLELCGCLKLSHLPLRKPFDFSFPLQSLIFLDLGFCNLHKVPDAIGELGCLERLNLEGNNFVSLPTTISRLYCLAYLNLSHCHELQSLPYLPSKDAPSVGRYYKTISGSRDHRSGLYIFDCPKLADMFSRNDNNSLSMSGIPTFGLCARKWITRLVEEPRHFRCGFDIVGPYWECNCYSEFLLLLRCFDHTISDDSVIRVVHCNVDDDWIGFVFCVAFEAKSLPTISGSPFHPSSSPLPHHFYLSFESECTEQRFDMPLDLELDKIDGSPHIWIIYISRQHCHFIETGAHITFKACPGLVVKKWGFHRLVKKDIEVAKGTSASLPRSRKGDLVIDVVEKGNSSSSGPKIQLPYNWLVTEEDEVENFEVKAKENDLCNIGL